MHTNRIGAEQPERAVGTAAAFLAPALMAHALRPRERKE